MLKNTYLACLDLQKILKERIKGRIFVSIEKDCLSVNINPGKGINYRRNVNDISYRLNIEDVANEIEYDYRNFITDIYFKRNFSGC